MSEIDDRRERAREAHDEMHGFHPDERFDTALRVATQVRITPEAIEAARVAGDFELNALVQINAGLAAGLAALGFEVEQ